jgi:hypothetical protein
MRELSDNEIARTAFSFVLPKSGDTIDRNKICPYCKNQDTDIVRDVAYLIPFKTFYKELPFQVIHCHCCSAVFSYCMSDKI